MHIVIIDDEQTNCKLLEIYVKKWGYKSISFTNSLEALEYLRMLDEPAVVCIDWMMPEMSGVEVLSKIRQERPDFPLYFLMLTAKVGQDNVVEALDAGADDFVLKPFDSKELRSRIGAGQRVINLEHKIMEKDRKLEKINNRLKNTLNIIENDIKAGKAVQFKLLPQNEKCIEGYLFRHYVEPSLYLSGDFLDYYSVNGRFIGFYFIDVAGHGASSAFVTIFVKSFYSNFISKYKHDNDESILDPALLVGELNSRIIETNLGKHLTIFTGIIDKEKQKLIYCNAGQFPFPVLCANSDCFYLDQKGFPVGLIPGKKYKNHEMDLPQNFKLYLFSDGLLDIMSEKNLQKQQEYILHILRKKNMTYKKFLKKVGFKKGCCDLPDDITCMVIKNGDLNA